VFTKNRHGATVAYGSPKPLIWVRILVPVQNKFWNYIIFKIIKIKNEQIINYFEQAYDELIHKVTWPTWHELQQSTLITLVSIAFLLTYHFWYGWTFRISV
jgi:preprotein translocase SecE subunit